MCRATANGEQFEDTYKRKPIVFIYGGRPFTGGLCQGVEDALSDMRGGVHTFSFLFSAFLHMSGCDGY